LDCGFQEAGFSTVLAIDNALSAVDSFNLNLKQEIAIQADLVQLRSSKLIELIDSRCRGVRPVGIIGGPPCQGFSIGNVYSDPDDIRNQLPFRFSKLLGQLNQHYSIDFFVFENVLGLTTAKHSDRFKKIKTAFRRAGFNLFEQEIDAMKFGVPQARKRLFVIGLNNRLYAGQIFNFPMGSETRTNVRDAIGNLPEPTYFVRGMKSAKSGLHPNHWTMMPKSSRFATGDYNSGRSFKKLEWDKASPTVAYGNREIHIHPDGGRRLSVYEAMLLQGFPRDYQLVGNLSEQITQVCNAVPPPVALEIAIALRTLIETRAERTMQTISSAGAYP